MFELIQKTAISTLLAGALSSTAMAQSTPNPIVTTDVSAGSGLETELYGGPTRHSMGVVWVDVNNDDFPDVFVTNGFDDGDGRDRRPHLYVNNGAGGFTLSDNLLPNLPNYEYVGAIAADYDRDGDVDIFVYTASEFFDVETVEGNPFAGPPNLLLKNNFVENGNIAASGMFTDVAAFAGVEGCPVNFGNLILADDSSAEYTCVQTRGAAFLDYDLDGWIDIYSAQMAINRVSSDDPMKDYLGKYANSDIVFRNMGDGTFQPLRSIIRAGDATNRSALAVSALHLNDDIWPDVYVGNVGGPVVSLEEDRKDSILINDQQGHLDLAHEYIGNDTPAAMGIASGDINSDGRFDLYITDVHNHPSNGTDPNRVGNTLYVSHEDGFSPNIGQLFGLDFYMSWGANFADFDLDGAIDLFVGSGLPNQTTAPDISASAIFSGLDSFAPTRLTVPTTNNRGSALADYDQDGDVDLLVVNQDGHLQLFRNDSTIGANKSFTLKVNPSRSNLDAIGLKVEIKTVDGKRLTQQITGGNSAHSQDDSVLIFGLGDSEIFKMRLTWPHPDTPVQVLTGPFPASLTVSEP